MKTNLNRTLRILAIFCYFLPLAKCNHEYKEKVEVDIPNVAQDSIRESIVIKDTGTSDAKDNITMQDSAKVDQKLAIKNDNESLIEKIGDKLVSPTPNSYSVIGVVMFFENIYGSILMVLSFLLSIVLVLLYKRIRSMNLVIQALIVNLAALILFILDVVCFTDEWELLWGIWVLLSIIIIQILLEHFIKTNKELI